MMLNVLVLNDEITPMDFVASVLREVFGHSGETAKELTLLAHLNGEVVCGFCRDRAEATDLIGKATAMSRQNGYPLSFSTTPASVRRRIAEWLFHLVMELAPKV
jgi:ATP-dependent Clp protease adaptor protein ClpS